MFRILLYSFLFVFISAFNVNASGTGIEGGESIDEFPHAKFMSNTNEGDRIYDITYDVIKKTDLNTIHAQGVFVRGYLSMLAIVDNKVLRNQKEADRELKKNKETFSSITGAKYEHSGGKYDLYIWRFPPGLKLSAVGYRIVKGSNGIYRSIFYHYY